MSQLPMILGLADDLNRLSMAPFYGYDQPSHYYRCPYFALAPMDKKMCQREHEAGHALSKIGKDGFQVCMDVQQFKPSELNVKVVDNSVVVEGKHEEREDEHGYIQRHFVRRYAIPKGYEADKVQSTLSSDGVLTVTVPKPAAIEDASNERVIQIQQVGPAHLNVKANKQEEIKDAGAA